MNKNIITFLFLATFCIPVASQETYYYKLKRCIIEGVSSTDVTGGQFVSFIGNVCYESDSQGRGVGHGTLQYKQEYTKNGIIFYWGNSFYGKETAFRFNEDKTILNVTSSAGNTYIYSRCIPPDGVTTCSLIRKPLNGNNEMPSCQENQGYILHPLNDYTPPLDNGKTLKTMEIRYKEKCHNCRGKGSTIHNTYPPTFGLPPTNVWCSECGKYYSSDVGHSHVPCRYCRGTGEVEKVRYENVYE